ncbi:hypothetical protein FOA52_015146 [Chlamydomonas sp. UWO 241]|nr:hypothetical protein FOA52_015146 [Chlamydomonas sp. UWO 241]
MSSRHLGSQVLFMRGDVYHDPPGSQRSPSGGGFPPGVLANSARDAPRGRPLLPAFNKDSMSRDGDPLNNSATAGAPGYGRPGSGRPRTGSPAASVSQQQQQQEPSQSFSLNQAYASGTIAGYTPSGYTPSGSGRLTSTPRPMLPDRPPSGTVAKAGGGGGGNGILSGLISSVRTGGGTGGSPSSLAPRGRVGTAAAAGHSSARGAASAGARPTGLDQYIPLDLMSRSLPRTGPNSSVQSSALGSATARRPSSLAQQGSPPVSTYGRQAMQANALAAAQNYAPPQLASENSALGLSREHSSSGFYLQQQQAYGPSDPAASYGSAGVGPTPLILPGNIHSPTGNSMQHLAQHHPNNVYSPAGGTAGGTFGGTTINSPMAYSPSQQHQQQHPDGSSSPYSVGVQQPQQLYYGGATPTVAQYPLSYMPQGVADGRAGSGSGSGTHTPPPLPSLPQPHAASTSYMQAQAAQAAHESGSAHAGVRTQSMERARERLEMAAKVEGERQTHARREQDSQFQTETARVRQRMADDQQRRVDEARAVEARRLAEVEARQRAAEDAAQRQAALDMAQRRAAEDQAAAAHRRAVEDAAAQQRASDEASHRRIAEEAATQRRAVEAAQRRASEEQAALQRRADEAAAVAAQRAPGSAGSSAGHSDDSCASLATRSRSGDSVTTNAAAAATANNCRAEGPQPWPWALPGSVPPGAGCVGLRNLGNTCYMNSILQALNCVPELIGWLLSQQGSMRGKVAPAYAELIASMWGSSGSAVSPSAFVRKISAIDSRWGDGSQQDAQELLHCLLEGLQADTNRVSSKPTYRELAGKGPEAQQASEALEYARSWFDSPVDDIFGGLMQSTLTCKACGRQSHCFETFLDLSVPIVGTTTTDCLAAFTSTEKLEGGDSYKCEGCKAGQPHTKRLQLYRYPRVLILTLKRFSQKPDAMRHRSRRVDRRAEELAPVNACWTSKPISSGLLRRFRSSTAKNSASVGLVPPGGKLDLTAFCNPEGLRAQAGGTGGPGAVGGGFAAGLPPVYDLIAVSHHSGSLEGGHYTASGRSAADSHSWNAFNDSSVNSEGGAPHGASSSAYVLMFRLSSAAP